MTMNYHQVIGGMHADARHVATPLHRGGCGVKVVRRRLGADDPAESRVDDITVFRVGPAGDRRASGKWRAIPSFLSQTLALKDDVDAIVCIDYRGIGVAAVMAGRRFRRTVGLPAGPAGRAGRAPARGDSRVRA